MCEESFTPEMDSSEEVDAPPSPARPNTQTRSKPSATVQTMYPATFLAQISGSIT